MFEFVKEERDLLQRSIKLNDSNSSLKSPILSRKYLMTRRNFSFIL